MSVATISCNFPRSAVLLAGRNVQPFLLFWRAAKAVGRLCGDGGTLPPPIMREEKAKENVVLSLALLLRGPLLDDGMGYY